MPRYVDQNLFNMMAINIAWMRTFDTSERATKEKALDELLDVYRREYSQDPFEQELWRAVEAFDGWLHKSYPEPRQYKAWLNIFRIAVEKFEPDGRRKKRKWLGGTWFSPRIRPADRFGQFMKDVAMYFVSVESGKITDAKR